MDVNKHDTWDYFWNYTVLSNGGVVVTPPVNMITNIGYDNNATNTKLITGMSNLKLYDLIQVNGKLDTKALRIINPNKFKKLYYLIRNLIYTTYTPKK